MKLRFLFSLSVLVMLFVPSAFGFEAKITNVIQDRYALLLITDVDPEQPLDKEAILALAQKEFDSLNVEQFQFAVYDKGKKQGDGARAFGEKRKDKSIEVKEFIVFEGEYAKERGLVAENFLGYGTTPQDIYNAYVENEVAADEDFTKNYVVMSVTVPRVEKDPYGNPNIKIPLDRSGSKLFQIYLDKKDPFLRKLKQGSDILLKVRAKGFVMDNRVIVDGIVLYDGTSVLMEGKLYTPPKKEEKKAEEKQEPKTDKKARAK